MIIVECQQGTPEWLAARAGVNTASNFRVMRQREKNGKTLTKTARKLAFGTAIERFIGGLLDAPNLSSWAMQRGQRLEEDARIEHMAEIGEIVRPVGMVLSDDRLFGASADGWINEDGGAEYKCLIGIESLYDIYVANDTSFYMDQVMGNLWLSGRAWWDFCVYCPNLRVRNMHFWRRRIERDEAYIEAMIYDLLDFNNVVEEYVEILEHQCALREGRVTPEDVNALMASFKSYQSAESPF